MNVTPKEGLRALHVVLTLAEHFQADALMVALLDYIKAAGGKVAHLGPQEWVIEVAEEDLEGPVEEPEGSLEGRP